VAKLFTLDRSAHEKEVFNVSEYSKVRAPTPLRFNRFPIVGVTEKVKYWDAPGVAGRLFPSAPIETVSVPLIPGSRNVGVNPTPENAVAVEFPSESELSPLLDVNLYSARAAAEFWAPRNNTEAANWE
jgi:hypothetical protein